MANGKTLGIAPTRLFYKERKAKSYRLLGFVRIDLQRVGKAMRVPVCPWSQRLKDIQGFMSERKVVDWKLLACDQVTTAYWTSDVIGIDIDVMPKYILANIQMGFPKKVRWKLPKMTSRPNGYTHG